MAIEFRSKATDRFFVNADIPRSPENRWPPTATEKNGGHQKPAFDGLRAQSKRTARSVSREGQISVPSTEAERGCSVGGEQIACLLMVIEL
ncbi:unnamed protein product [Anisakis simplex]|uniref:Uncharacterized protein n=1 Tax=Anisakis simplex TaxID=6269 RepID=A0A0M3JS29_ANISI|nr:unnamed protein product [Anisakis simplex]